MGQQITVEKIRAMYPNPVTAREGIENERYCVGGALCLYTGMETYIPMTATLANRLRVVNPALFDMEFGTVKDKGYNYAARIVHANDDGEFETAWRLLGEALTYTSILIKEGKEQ